MKRTMKLLICLTFAIVAVLCIASCDQLANGFSTHQHTWGAWGEDTATCEAEGTQTRVCQSCREKQTRKTAALGHDMVSYKDKAPDCTEPGYTNYKKCSRCDNYEGTLTEPKGHTHTVWTNNTATCVKGGTEESLCDECGIKEKRSTEKLGHNINYYGECETCHKSDIVVLIENGIAKFDVVVTSKAGGDGMYAAEEFVKALRARGIEMNDVAMDSETTGAVGCEIIIGSGAVGRGDACKITERELGTDGTVLKIVGNKIVIAGATSSLSTAAFNKFVSETLGITDATGGIDYLEVDSSCCYEKTSEYILNSIKIANNDLSGYGFVLDVSAAMSYGVAEINAFHDRLFEISGYWLNYVPVVSANFETGKYFVIRYTEDAGDTGFRAYVSGDDFIIECAHKNVFDDAFKKFANTNILFKSGSISFDSNYLYEDVVNVVYYEDVLPGKNTAAVGDGTTCDFEAIYNVHIFANQGGQKVMSKKGSSAVYYISAKNFTKQIPIRTDVDFCGATFRINDVGEDAYANRKKGLFVLDRDYKAVGYYDNDKNVVVVDENGNPVLDKDNNIQMTTDGVIDKEEFKNITIEIGQTSFPWIVDYLSGKSLVRVTNKLHRDFIRHGANQNSGAYRTDIFVVNTDGTLESDSLPVFKFDNISAIEIFRADEKPITVENGNFINICCRTVESTEYIINGADDDKTNDIKTTHANKFHEYYRGFVVNRSNATMKNIKHTMEAEPELGWYLEGCGYTPDAKHYNPNNGKIWYGSRHESYPYYGFVFANHTYNFTLTESELTGHTTYYEDKPATASTGWEIPAPVPMGTYDFVLEYSSKITFNEVIQTTPTDLVDTRYWGIMSSNGCKNLTFTGCEINRFDAHRGFWNATIKDTIIGHSFQVIGGGTLYVENVTKQAKSNFMTFRGDYGTTFEGNITVVNCTHEARKTYSSWTGSAATAGKEGTVYLFNCDYPTYNQGYSTKDPYGGYWTWDFGYTCYMPINVVIDNFKSSSTNTYVFNDLPDIIFESTYQDGVAPGKFTVRYPYQITKSITQKNMKKAINTCSGTYQRNTVNGYRDYPTFTYNKLKAIKVTKVNIG